MFQGGSIFIIALLFFVCIFLSNTVKPKNFYNWPQKHTWLSSTSLNIGVALQTSPSNPNAAYINFHVLAKLVFEHPID